ncbi:MAG: ferritin-like domain-containing protein [Planctomycetes bacterium]|nr:ferritin-like domain-containing protein [Planctomycetota bacterium]
MRRERTSAEWIDYFDANEANWSDIPWQRGAQVTLEPIRSLVRSLQAWQLGETSEARRLKTAAKRHAYAIGDPDFVEAMNLFIAEEQRHGEALGRWLDDVGAERLKRDLGDSLFRFFRHARPNIEVWTTVVTMIETIAVVYYSSVRRAIPSPLLQAVCEQILRDEMPHLEFQTERLRLLLRNRRPIPLWLTLRAQEVFFTGMVLVVWLAHRRMFVAGGHTFVSYLRATFRHMQHAWQAMRPRSTRSPVAEPPSRLEGWLH